MDDFWYDRSPRVLLRYEVSPERRAPASVHVNVFFCREAPCRANGDQTDPPVIGCVANVQPVPSVAARNVRVETPDVSNMLVDGRCVGRSLRRTRDFGCRSPLYPPEPPLPSPPFVMTPNFLMKLRTFPISDHSRPQTKCSVPPLTPSLSREGVLRLGPPAALLDRPGWLRIATSSPLGK